MNRLREEAEIILRNAIEAVLPEPAVQKKLKEIEEEGEFFQEEGQLVVISFGKAAWRMAKAAQEELGEKIDRGLVITKYGHVEGSLKGFTMIEAGHPLPDHQSVTGAALAMDLVAALTENDRVVTLVSGGGSALFEKPVEGVTLDSIQSVTDQLLAKGAEISEINTIRKRLSAVKGGRFAEACGKAQMVAIVLSDVLGDRLDVIASGPMVPDLSLTADALSIAKKYNLKMDDASMNALKEDTPKKVSNCRTIVAGNVNNLCKAAAKSASQLGYKPMILTSSLDCEAREAGRMMASVARELTSDSNTSFTMTPPCAVILGGETVVHVTGKGKGGRNQELALAAAFGIQQNDRVVIMSAGSDGTDGPTDAAGGLVDGKSIQRMKTAGVLPEARLLDNDSYHALKASDDLIMTGPTGTNVNDLMMILCR